MAGVVFWGGKGSEWPQDVAVPQAWVEFGCGGCREGDGGIEVAGV